MIPTWMDRTLRKAVHPDPEQRYGLLSEFIHDLTHPNPELMSDFSRPLLEKNPIAFWRGLTVAMIILNCVLIYLLLS